MHLFHTKGIKICFISKIENLGDGEPGGQGVNLTRGRGSGTGKRKFSGQGISAGDPVPAQPYIELLQCAMQLIISRYFILRIEIN